MGQGGELFEVSIRRDRDKKPKDILQLELEDLSP